MEKYDTATIRHMRIACYVTEATDTYSEYVILIVFHGKMVRPRPFTVMFLLTLPVVFANSSQLMKYPCVNVYTNIKVPRQQDGLVFNRRNEREE